MANFKISSSFGYLIVDSKNGLIVEYKSSKGKHDYLPDVKKIDVAASRVLGVISRYGQLNCAVTFLLMALNQSIAIVSLVCR